MTNTDTMLHTTYHLLEGTWVNQLGSEVTFMPDSLGRLHGEYCAGAGSLAGRRCPVVGTYQRDLVGRTVPLAFVVGWSEAHCVTSWTGHFLPEQDEIDTTWLMAAESDSHDEWKSTVIGHDVFRRVTDTGT